MKLLTNYTTIVYYFSKLIITTDNRKYAIGQKNSSNIDRIFPADFSLFLKMYISCGSQNPKSLKNSQETGLLRNFHQYPQSNDQSLTDQILNQDTNEQTTSAYTQNKALDS
ncbi:hypothetical protein MTR_2g071755 [Medicago truncatula]|uniref:Uncharacterized protein n=1 Tax=Medicago truncatula TaxID=3880 RepID=A0A072VA10_MEDTR|nr:hypothetical protein MTR_2g071755 [Medicago truncatula]